MTLTSLFSGLEKRSRNIPSHRAATNDRCLAIVGNLDSSELIKPDLNAMAQLLLGGDGTVAGVYRVERDVGFICEFDLATRENKTLANIKPKFYQSVVNILLTYCLRHVFLSHRHNHNVN
jgi:hypothetical protein